MNKPNYMIIMISLANVIKTTSALISIFVLLIFLLNNLILKESKEFIYLHPGVVIFLLILSIGTYLFIKNKS
jgi:hypothetical protein